MHPVLIPILCRGERILRVLTAVAAVVAASCAPAPRGPSAPGPSAGTVQARGGVPVMAWHAFDEQAGTQPGSLTESYASFEAFLVFLKENGFRSVFPEQVRPGDDLSRLVVLTFDDGTRSNLRAAEMMERHGFRGIFFVIPARTGAGGGSPFMDAAEVERLARAGHRVAPHGYEHRSMAGSGTEVAATLVRSARMVGQAAGTAPAEADFAFPFGHYTAEVAEAVGGRFRYLHTVNPGSWDGVSPMLPRMLVMAGVDPALFRDYVLGGAGYAPVLEPLTPDGKVARQIAFRARGPLPDSVEIFAITSDAADVSYNRHPLGAHLSVRGDTVWVDLGGYMGTHFPPGRMVISYAVVAREGGGLRYLSPGLLNWVRDPSAMPHTHDPAPSPGEN